MFGSDIIRIKVKGYLRNITDNEIFEFEERGIKILSILLNVMIMRL